MALDGRSYALVLSAALIVSVFASATGAPAAPEAEEAAKAERGAPAGTQVAQAGKKKKPDPVAAQRTIDSGVKLLEAKKPEQAAQVLSSVITGGNLPPPVMAKALLYRGIAYRQQKMPAQAISDFTSALWFKGGLNEAERADALRHRDAAYQEAGLTQGGEIQSASLPKESRRSGERAEAPQSSSAPAAPAAALGQDQSASPAPTSSGGSWFDNLFSGGTAFGGASPSATTEPSAPVDAAAILNRNMTTAEVPRRTRRPAPQASAWSQNTEVQKDAARVETAAISRSETVRAEPARSVVEGAAPAKRKGHLRVQLAAVRTQAEAQALAAKVKREYAGVLASRVPEIDQTVMGNMGSFYRVLIGPFASAQETQSVCARLKGSGLDCLVTAQ